MWRLGLGGFDRWTIGKRHRYQTTVIVNRLNSKGFNLNPFELRRVRLGDTTIEIRLRFLLSDSQPPLRLAAIMILLYKKKVTGEWRLASGNLEWTNAESDYPAQSQFQHERGYGAHTGPWDLSHFAPRSLNSIAWWAKYHWAIVGWCTSTKGCSQKFG